MTANSSWSDEWAATDVVNHSISLSCWLQPSSTTLVNADVQSSLSGGTKPPNQTAAVGNKNNAAVADLVNWGPQANIGMGPYTFAHIYLDQH